MQETGEYRFFCVEILETHNQHLVELNNSKNGYNFKVSFWISKSMIKEIKSVYRQFGLYSHPDLREFTISPKFENIHVIAAVYDISISLSELSRICLTTQDCYIFGFGKFLSKKMDFINVFLVRKNPDSILFHIYFSHHFNHKMDDMEPFIEIPDKAIISIEKFPASLEFGKKKLLIVRVDKWFSIKKNIQTFHSGGLINH